MSGPQISTSTALAPPSSANTPPARPRATGPAITTRAHSGLPSTTNAAHRPTPPARADRGNADPAGPHTRTRAAITGTAATTPATATSSAANTSRPSSPATATATCPSVSRTRPRPPAPDPARPAHARPGRSGRAGTEQHRHLGGARAVPQHQRGQPIAAGHRDQHHPRARHHRGQVAGHTPAAPQVDPAAQLPDHLPAQQTTHRNRPQPGQQRHEFWSPPRPPTQRRRAAHREPANPPGPPATPPAATAARPPPAAAPPRPHPRKRSRDPSRARPRASAGPGVGTAHTHAQDAAVHRLDRTRHRVRHPGGHRCGQCLRVRHRPVGRCRVPCPVPCLSRAPLSRALLSRTGPWRGSVRSAPVSTAGRWPFTARPPAGWRVVPEGGGVENDFAGGLGALPAPGDGAGRPGRRS